MPLWTFTYRIFLNICLYSSLGYIARSEIAGSYGHFMVNSFKVEVIHLCLTLCDPMEWVAIPFSRESAQPRSPTLQADSLPAEPQGKPKNSLRHCQIIFQSGHAISHSHQQCVRVSVPPLSDIPSWLCLPCHHFLSLVGAAPDTGGA